MFLLSLCYSAALFPNNEEFKSNAPPVGTLQVQSKCGYQDEPGVISGAHQRSRHLTGGVKFDR